MGAIEEKVAGAAAGRIIKTYKIPTTLQNDAVPGFTIPTSVGVKALTADEELQAHHIGRFDTMKAQYDAVKRSIVELDGRKVRYGVDGTIDVFWEKCGPKLRSLMLQQYGKSSSPSKEEENDFFASEVTQAS